MRPEGISKQKSQSHCKQECLESTDVKKATILFPLRFYAGPTTKCM